MPPIDDERQRARPKGAGKELGVFTQQAVSAGFAEILNQNDQGFFGWPRLGREDFLHRRLVARIGAQAVKRFGGEGDQAAMAQNIGGDGYIVGAGRQHLRAAKRLRHLRPRATK